jgi:type II secretory pathway pseudopilin PulG
VKIATNRTARLSQRNGAALLEVMVALTILAVAGMWAVALVNQSVEAIHQVREADIAIRRANGFMEAVALWPRQDLDRHLGRHREGEWVLTVQRPAMSLYTIVLSAVPDTLDGRPLGRDLLSTAVFRPEVPDSAR